jgi:hypothetical protein
MDDAPRKHQTQRNVLVLMMIGKLAERFVGVFLIKK